MVLITQLPQEVATGLVGGTPWLVAAMGQYLLASLAEDQPKPGAMET